MTAWVMGSPCLTLCTVGAEASTGAQGLRCGVSGQGTLAQHVALCNAPRAPGGRGRRLAWVLAWVSPCVSVCLGVRVAVFTPTLSAPALIGKMKSASWIELGSASFLCLGPKPPEPEIGNSFPQLSTQGLGEST